MRVFGWAAVIYAVHDEYTLAALLLLLAGEFALSNVHRKSGGKRMK